MNRRSHPGLIIYVKKFPYYGIVRSRTQWSLLVLDHSLLEFLRYKLISFGIPINGPYEVFWDNKLVVTNTRVPESVLNKRHNNIFYHRIREAHKQVS